MRFENKQRAVVALIAVVALWPAIQHAAVRASGGNPWHFFGMAMYCVPHSVTGVQVGQRVDGEIREFDRKLLTPDIERRVVRYTRLFESIGRWAPVEGLDAALARAAPEAEAVVVAPRNLFLNPVTARVEERETRMVFPTR
jgi:hypothetical protein